jgi:N-acetyl-anhydromuramyl-L-alanine amidase AmpD
VVRVAAAALVVLLGPARARAEPAMVDRPISWTSEREELTVAYRRIHQDPAIDDSRIEPHVIVLHYTGGSSWKATWRYFDRTRLERGREKLRRGGEVNVSAHFLVDRDGTIYRLLPETTMARHCIGLNHVAIGIENVGDGRRWPLTAAQVAANAALVRHLAGRHSITHLIGHSESNAMRRHRYWRERDVSYRNSKGDPGRGFLAQVRARVADLALEAAPGP